MKIELEGPYANIWRLAYLVVEKNGRKIIILCNDNENRSTISYAKYVMSCKIGRVIEKNECVKHLDDDVTNDEEDNLKLLTKSECSILVNKTQALARRLKQLIV